MQERIGVPRHRIPKLFAVCPSCSAATKITMAVPFTEGYHRRHVCKRCAYTFYTITSYHGGAARQSALPFRDRPMTEEEREERVRWWTEETATPVGNPIEDWPFLKRVVEALNKKEEERLLADTIIVQVYQSLETQVAQMDATQEDYV